MFEMKSLVLYILTEAYDVILNWMSGNRRFRCTVTDDVTISFDCVEYNDIGQLRVKIKIL